MISIHGVCFGHTSRSRPDHETILDRYESNWAFTKASVQIDVLTSGGGRGGGEVMAYSSLSDVSSLRKKALQPQIYNGPFFSLCPL